jgi:hypothetical protein
LLNLRVARRRNGQFPTVEGICYIYLNILPSDETMLGRSGYHLLLKVNSIMDMRPASLPFNGPEPGETALFTASFRRLGRCLFACHDPTERSGDVRRAPLKTQSSRISIGKMVARCLSIAPDRARDNHQRFNRRLLFPKGRPADLLVALSLFFLSVETLLAQPVHSSRAFSPESFWYKPLPSDAPIHPNSAGFVREFLRQKKAYYGTVGISTTKYASPVYVAEEKTPRVAVRPWDCQKKGYIDRGLTAQWNSVPIPEYAQPADGTDSEMTVYSPSTNTMWEFWVARKTDGVWEACWGGRMENVSSSSGIWPFPYGTTATGLPFVGGQLSIDELQRGEINHVMGISLVDTERSSVVSWPANRSDGGTNAENASDRIPEGLRFRLDPAVDVNSLKMHPVGKAIARAAQIYGFVVWDKAGAIGLRAENPKSVTLRKLPDPYSAIFNGTASYAILEGFPWDRLQFLPMDYGKP